MTKFDSTLTERHSGILRFLESYIAENEYPPTVREIQRELRFQSASIVNHYLDQLEEMGFIFRDRTVSRGLRLIRRPVALEVEGGLKTVRIPIIGEISPIAPLPNLVLNDRSAYSEAIEIAVDLIDASEDTEALRAVEVTGDRYLHSMLFDGDILVIRPTMAVQDGDMVVAWLPERLELVVAHHYTENGKVDFRPGNPLIEPLFLSLDKDMVAVQAKVLLVIRPLEEERQILEPVTDSYDISASNKALSSESLRFPPRVQRSQLNLRALNWVAAAVFLGVLALPIVLAVLEYGRTQIWPTWTGFGDYLSPPVDANQSFFRGRNLWDLLELLIVPVVLLFGVFVLNRTQRSNELNRSDQQTQEDAVQSYLDKMTNLMLEQDLRDSPSKSDVKDVARARTITVLRNLDGDRKAILIQFLYEAELIDAESPVVLLVKADLTRLELPGIDLRQSNLDGARLSFANLRGANIAGASLQGAMLFRADLSNADLSHTDLRWANLTRCNLRDATMTQADLRGSVIERKQLRRVESLKGAKLPRSVE